MTPDHAAAKFNEAVAQCVATKVDAGLILADVKCRVGDAFPQWVVSACRTPLAEAELLMRWATARPSWVDPAVVDLKDPLAWQLMELGFDRQLREMGAPIGEAD